MIPTLLRTRGKIIEQRAPSAEPASDEKVEKAPAAIEAQEGSSPGGSNEPCCPL
jgi:hypothetical protein